MRIKQQVFVAEYLKDFNATQAALRAGYSPKTAYSIGQGNLKKLEIKEAIQAAIEERVMSKSEVLVRLAQQARGDIGDFMDIESMSFDLNLQKAKELGLTHLIKKARQRTVTTSKNNGQDEEETNIIDIELYDSQAALVQIGKHLKLFGEGEPLIVRVPELTELLDKVWGKGDDKES